MNWDDIDKICAKYRIWRINAKIVARCYKEYSDRIAFLRRLMNYNINLPNRMGSDLHDFTMEYRIQQSKEASDMKQLLEAF